MLAVVLGKGLLELRQGPASCLNSTTSRQDALDMGKNDRG